MKKHFRSDDVFIVSYPKSGTNWLGFMIGNIINENYKLKKLLTVKNYREVVPDINLALIKPKILKNYSHLPSPRIFTIHALPSFSKIFPKTIYIVRDPRAVMVSYYHHHRRYIRGFNKSLEKFIHDFENLSPSSWTKHVNGWLNILEEFNFRLVRYEDLFHNSESILKNILEYSNIPPDLEIIKKSVEAGKFENMVKLENKYGEGKEATGDSSVKYFRKGKAESYKEELSPELMKFINEKVTNTLKKHDLNYSI